MEEKKSECRIGQVELSEERLNGRKKRGEDGGVDEKEEADRVEAEAPLDKELAWRMLLSGAKEATGTEYVEIFFF